MGRLPESPRPIPSRPRPPEPATRPDRGADSGHAAVSTGPPRGSGPDGGGADAALIAALLRSVAQRR
jgi:hypothetical protein